MLQAYADNQSEDNELKKKYKTFRSLLKKNGHVLQLMSDLESDLCYMDYTTSQIRQPVREIIDEILLMAQELNLLEGDRHKVLYNQLAEIDNQLRNIFNKSESESIELDVNLKKSNYSAEVIGGKAYGLSVLNKNFHENVPEGFVLTTCAYRLFMEADNLNEQIKNLIQDLPYMKDENVTTYLETARNLIEGANVPDVLVSLINKNSDKISGCNKWAVRSSAVQEDDHFSFAGQFDSMIGVENDDLVMAFKKVIASRYTYRAMKYRLDHGFKEVDTPMAVLFMPQIEPAFSGVIYTNNPEDSENNSMIVNAVEGLSADMVKGKAQADTFVLTRNSNAEVLSKKYAKKAGSDSPLYNNHASEEMLKNLGSLCYNIMNVSDYDIDFEWAIDSEDKIWILQGRKIYTNEPEKEDIKKTPNATPIVEHGITIFPGRAEGKVHCIQSDSDIGLVEPGSIVITSQASPKLAPVLPHIVGLLVEGGSPVGHLATLVREHSVPCLFNVGEIIWKLGNHSIISMDATKRQVYRGRQWPGMDERMKARLKAKVRAHASGPLHDLILKLNLDDPHNSSFKAKNCKSLHDAIRYIHEMSVRSMFLFGDSQNKLWKQKALSIETPIPIKIKLIDLDGSAIANKGKVTHENIGSIPFKALFRGINTTGINWEKRYDSTFNSLPDDFVEQVKGGTKGPRRSKDSNYFIVSRDYVNFNARFAYHYAMIDAVATPKAEKNYVTLRFQGGGATLDNRKRRTMFLESVLRSSGFNVNRRNDLIAAWLRYCSMAEIESALETLGQLMGCVRELDIILTNDDVLKSYIKYFMEGNLKAFL